VANSSAHEKEKLPSSSTAFQHKVLRFESGVNWTEILEIGMMKPKVRHIRLRGEPRRKKAPPLGGRESRRFLPHSSLKFRVGTALDGRRMKWVIGESSSPPLKSEVASGLKPIFAAADQA